MFEYCQDMIDQLFSTDRDPKARIATIAPKPKPPKPIEPKPKTYVNTEAHPEFQGLAVDMGFRSVIMKQLEINERLLRALIDIEIKKLPHPAQQDMMRKYRDLI